ncbi:MAG: glycosyltransferase family 9 protein [Selenomonadaceae bacterium]|nr:glycosyltransferase family 9 protein [Selenomonadaceae bacterium]MBQ9496052.1 glycosyltransferase family 9 protein [Selenomonadaceae bacterium]
MAIYNRLPAHERLNFFFGELFHEMRTADPLTYEKFFQRAEEEFLRQGYREKNPSSGGGIVNILIVRLDAIGDQVLLSGFLREVRRNFPAAHITLVTSSIAAPMVEFCPYLNEVLILDRKFLSGNFIEMLEQIAVFCRENLWRKKFSVAFSPRWDFDTAAALLTCWLSGARERIGYCVNPFQSWLSNPPPQFAPRFGFLLTKDIVTPQSILSEVEKNFYLLAAVGLRVEQTHMELFFSAADAQRARELLENIPSTHKKVTLGIGGSAPTKKYPPEKYLVALKELVKKNFTFVIVGGRAEIEDANFLEKNLPPEKILNLVGKLTIRETEAVISQTDLYLGNDTGTLHMAAAAHVPVIGIYRGSVEQENILPAILNEYRRFPPWQTKAIALRPAHPLGDCATVPFAYGYCAHPEIPHCITQITPQEIVAAVEQMEREL